MKLNDEGRSIPPATPTRNESVGLPIGQPELIIHHGVFYEEKSRQCHPIRQDPMGQRPSGGLPTPPYELVQLRAVRPELTEKLQSATRTLYGSVFALSSERLRLQRKRRSLLPCHSRAVVWGLLAPTGCAPQPMSPEETPLPPCSDNDPKPRGGDQSKFPIRARLRMPDHVPSWNALSLSRPMEEAELEPNQPQVEWQQQASRQMEKKFVTDHLWPTFDNAQRALMMSQHGPPASAALTALPTSRATRIDPQPFSLFLCNRLHLPPPPCLTALADVAE